MYNTRYHHPRRGFQSQHS